MSDKTLIPRICVFISNQQYAKLCEEFYTLFDVCPFSPSFVLLIMVSLGDRFETMINLVSTSIIIFLCNLVGLFLMLSYP